MGRHSYLIALGSNQWGAWGSPQALLASINLDQIVNRSTIHTTVPLGPGTRRYANAVAQLETDQSPLGLLAHLKSVERAHGRRSSRRWGDRPLDLDIIGWSGGLWASPALSIPHPAFRQRRFVLAPLVEIAPGWRDPVTHLTARQLLARLDRKRARL